MYTYIPWDILYHALWMLGHIVTKQSRSSWYESHIWDHLNTIALMNDHTWYTGNDWDSHQWFIYYPVNAIGHN